MNAPARIACCTGEELLRELLQVAGRADSSHVPKLVMQKFGSIGAAVGSADQLDNDSFDDTIVELLRVLYLITVQAIRESIDQRPIFSKWDSVLNYFRVRLAHQRIERFHVLYLDGKNALIADEEHQRGTINHTPVYPREIMRRALELDAAALIMVHNHPSGNPKPSEDDILITRDVVDAGKTLEIVVHDHIVITRQGHASLRTLGMME